MRDNGVFKAMGFTREQDVLENLFKVLAKGDIRNNLIEAMGAVY
jgi:hypothetical protein